MVMSEIKQFPPAENEVDENAGSMLRSEATLSVPTTKSPIEPASKQILLGSLGDGRLRVIMPIAVTLTTENDDYIAEAEELSEFGFGKNPSEAINDLQRALAELWFTLQQERDRLGPDLLVLWSALQQKVKNVA